MYHVKMAFVLIQIGTKLWVNPTQIQGIAPGNGLGCETIVLVSNKTGSQCSDWTIDQVRAALSPAAVAKALEGK